VSIITIVGSNTISGQADSPDIILPNGSTANVGTQVTLTSGVDNPVVVSVGASGIYVASNSVASTYYTNPVGPGQVTPTAVPNTAALVPIGTIAGVVVSAAAGASTVVFQAQTITFGGSPVTLAGTNVVATLGSEGLVVQSEGGIVSSYTLPVAGPAVTGSIIGTVNGEILTAAPGANSVFIGSQTLVLGGLPVTLSDHEVLSLGSSGVVVQIPGGGVVTFPLPILGSSTSVSTTSQGPGVFIANSKFPICKPFQVVSD
jgi:hypothetical protein